MKRSYYFNLGGKLRPLGLTVKKTGEMFLSRPYSNQSSFRFADWVLRMLETGPHSQRDARKCACFNPLRFNEY